MKKVTVLLVAGLLMLLALTACSDTATKDNPDGKLKIVVTIFPAYDWTKQIIGENNDEVELTLILKNGVDIHSYQPTVDDIIKITTCDMLIYVGGESDKWIEDTLKQSENSDMIVINLLEALGDNAKIEETVEGMELGHEYEADNNHDEAELDEHVWLSLRNAQILSDTISQSLAALLPDAAIKYASNAADYIERLSKLDDEFAEMVSSAQCDTLIFCDRFPFRYLVDDYNLNYFAAFNGCSAETEASFETVVFLSNKTDELGLHSVIVLETSDKSIAKTVITNTKDKNAQILVLDSMQAITSEDIENGASYLSVMGENLDVIRQALDY